MVEFPKVGSGASQTQVKEVVLCRGGDTSSATEGVKEQLGTDVYVYRFGHRELTESHLMTSFFNGNWGAKASAGSEVNEV